jgi:hypothetical protein
MNLGYYSSMGMTKYIASFYCSLVGHKEKVEPVCDDEYMMGTMKSCSRCGYVYWIKRGVCDEITE